MVIWRLLSAYLARVLLSLIKLMYVAKRLRATRRVCTYTYIHAVLVEEVISVNKILLFFNNCLDCLVTFCYSYLCRLYFLFIFYLFLLAEMFEFFYKSLSLMLLNNYSSLKLMIYFVLLKYLQLNFFIFFFLNSSLYIYDLFMLYFAK